jgi:hypothetical protein
MQRQIDPTIFDQDYLVGGFNVLSFYIREESIKSQIPVTPIGL